MNRIPKIVFSLFIFLFSSATTAQLLTVEQADIDLTAERLDYAGTFVDFTDTGLASDFLAGVGLINVNGESAFVVEPITTFNGTVLVEDNFDDIVCGTGLELIVSSARLSTVDGTLAATARICNYTCDVDVNNFQALFALQNDAIGELNVQQVPLTSFAPEGCVEPPEVTVIEIDIKPRSNQNRVNPNSRGRIKVAILGSGDFDALQAKLSTVRFGPDGAKPIRWRTRVRDVNRDSYPDLVLQFKIRRTGIQCGDTEAELTGETHSGESFVGTDLISTVGCN